MPAIIVFAAVPWEAGWGWPQQVLRRLAKDYRIVYVEAPLPGRGAERPASYSPAPNVLVCRPCTPHRQAGWHAGQLPYLRQAMRQLDIDRAPALAWIGTPEAQSCLAALRPGLLMYDGIQPWRAGRPAAQQRALIERADIVFTREPGAYAANGDARRKLRMLSDGVDAGHFAAAWERANAHPAHRGIAGPRLGYAGVIDARIDLDLLAGLADAHPQWQVVLAGPVRGIECARLPRRGNLHYLGDQPYAAWPQLLAGWDVCLLPYARNAINRHYLPPQALAYLAAELPVVATPLPVVAERLRDAVALADGKAAFIAHCEAALLEPAAWQEKRVCMRGIVAGASWDRVADEVSQALRAERWGERASWQFTAKRVGIVAAPAPVQPRMAPNAVYKTR